MKFSFLPSILLLIITTPNLKADDFQISNRYQEGFLYSNKCFRNEYREQYIPGSFENPGYVKSWRETIEVPCYKISNLYKKNNYITTDGSHKYKSYERRLSQSGLKKRNTCKSSNKTIGGLIGGSTAAALSSKDAYAWTIPLGAVLGMGIASSNC